MADLLEELKQTQRQLRACTKELKWKPYEPVSWLNRAYVLADLGYPELALGDCYKAQLRLDACRSTFPSEGDATWQAQSKDYEEIEHDILLLTAYSLCAVECYKSALEMCEEGIRKFPDTVEFQTYHQNCKTHQPPHRPYIQDLNGLDKEDAQKAGYLFLEPYPWMSSDMFRRGPDVKRRLIQRFLSDSAGKCMIRRSSLRANIDRAGTAGVPADVLGVFATADLQEGEHLLTDTSAIGALDDFTDHCHFCCGALPTQQEVGQEVEQEVELSCCKERFCRQSCADHAQALYHSAVCGKNLDEFQNASREGKVGPGTASQDLLLLRVLAMCVQDSTRPPLEMPVLAQLTATYGGQYDWPFEYHSRTIRPIKMLQALGVDVFADLNYDTWVMHTIQVRLWNNQISEVIDGRSKLYLSHLWAAFNHSCAPNVAVDSASVRTSTRFRLVTTRQVSKQEELFVSYVTFDKLQEAGPARRYRLFPGLGCACQCAKCLEEERRADDVGQGSVDQTSMVEKVADLLVEEQNAASAVSGQ